MSSKTGESTTTIEALTKTADPDYDQPKDVYEFSNGRKFRDPKEQGGAYDGNNSH